MNWSILDQIGPAVLYHAGLIFSAAFLCFYTVQERLKRGFLSSLAWAVLSAIPYAFWTVCVVDRFGINSIVGLLPFLALAFLFFLRRTTIEAPKVIFIMLVVINQMYLVTSVQMSLTQMLLSDTVDPRAVYNWTGAVAEAVTALFCIPPTAWFLRKKLWPAVRDGDKASFWKLCSLPLACALLNAFILEHVTVRTLESVQYVFFVVLLAVCSFLWYWIVIRMLYEAAENARNSERLVQMGFRLRYQTERFSEIAAHVDEMRILRHDMRHHLGVLSGFLSEGQPEKASEYLQEYARGLEDMIEPQLCTNSAVDIVARRYSALAKQMGVDAEFSIALPEEAGIASTDLCIVLGNLIENALNALEKQKTGERLLRVSVRAEENHVLIAVDNSVEEGGSPQREAGGSGLGIPSVQAIARKYSGMAGFECNGGMFEASVLLQKSDAFLEQELTDMP